MAAEPQQIVLIPDEPMTLTPATLAVATIAGDALQPASKELVDSVKRFGILQPIVVRVQYGTRDVYDIVDGRRRLDAARKAGLGSVPSLIVETDLAISDVMTLTANATRAANRVAEFEAIKRLVGMGATEREISAATGMSRATIKARMKLLSLSPALTEAFRQGKISATLAEGAAKQPQAIQDALNVTLLVNGKLTERDLHDVKTAKAQAAMAQLPTTMFALDPVAPLRDAPAEPEEVVLAREINSILDRLPPFVAEKQSLIRHSLETAATILMDIGMGQVPDKEAHFEQLRQDLEGGRIKLVPDEEVLQGEAPTQRYMEGIDLGKDGSSVRVTLDTETNTVIAVHHDEQPGDFTPAIECPERPGKFCGDEWCIKVGCCMKDGLAPPEEE